VAAALEGAAACQLVSMIANVQENLARAGQAAAPAGEGVKQTIGRIQALGN
jgi:hypothetical protein